MTEPGRLIVCATPIGNLGDVTVRVLAALREADLVLAEDTRITKRLLAHYDIDARLERYDDNVAERVTPEIVSRIGKGAVYALVSDAGTPGISDPGERLIAACIAAALPVEVLPGPSAIVTALVASGLPARAFYFGGFLPRKPGEARRALRALADLDATLAFYESPRRAGASLAAIAEVFPIRRVALARELTKLHEEVLRGTAAEVGALVAAREGIKGEVVLLIGPPAAEEAGLADPASLAVLVEGLVSEGLSRSDAVKMVARESGAPRKAVYDAAHRAGETGVEP